MELLTSLASACLGRSLLPRERAGVPTVPRVVEAMLSPTADSAASLP